MILTQVAHSEAERLRHALKALHSLATDYRARAEEVSSRAHRRPPAKLRGLVPSAELLL